MLIIKKNSKQIFNCFLLIYLIVGLYLSVNTGIPTDVFYDQYNWNLSYDVIKFYIGNIGDENFKLLDYQWKYHGVGFHYFSEIYLYLIGLLIKFEELSKDTSKIILNHSLIFITFFLSGIFAKKIVYLIIKNKIYSNLFLTFYLFYPYLLGHGFNNPKDTPFLFAWILSTYVSFKIFIKFFKRENITFLHIFLLSLTTSFLFSIRISGTLILLQYLITLVMTCKILKEPFYKILKIYFNKIIFFILVTGTLTIAFYPIFWINPLFFLDSIVQASNIPYSVCTLTLGKCVSSLNLPSSYILIWLFFKLPLLSFVGFVLFPFIEKKIFSDPVRQILMGSILLTIIIIIFLLIFNGVNLYDELRHILFLVPLILIASFSTIFLFSRKILLYSSIISIFIFSIQNINMYPYQYTWFNSFSNFVNINENFELDYWGISGRNLAKHINNTKILLDHKKKCIYVSPKHLVEPFINRDYNCVKLYFSIFPKSTEKYILVKYTRNIRRENPSGCKLVHEESYNLNLFNKKLKMGEIYLCN